MKDEFKHRVERADAQTKVNPLDLSSDQDLTIALINLVAIEQIAPSQPIGQMVREVRENLMSPMIRRCARSGCDTDAAYDLLVTFINMVKAAENAQESGDFHMAYDMYNRAYESYVLFLAIIYGISA